MKTKRSEDSLTDLKMKGVYIFWWKNIEYLVSFFLLRLVVLLWWRYVCKCDRHRNGYKWR